MNPGSERNYYENNGIRLRLKTVGWQSATLLGLTAQGTKLSAENRRMLRQTLARIGRDSAQKYGVEKIA